MKFYENNQTEKQQSLQEEYDNLKNCSAEQLMQKLANEASGRDEHEPPPVVFNDHT